MQTIVPYCDENAIKVVAYAIDFANEIDDKVIHKAIAFYNDNDSLKQDLPHMNPQKSLKIEVRNGIQLHQEELGGVSFEKVDTSGDPVWSLLFRKNALAITCRKYTRWDEISSQAKSYLLTMLNILDGVQVASTTLEYVDEFIVADTSPSWQEALFKKESRYITHNIFDVEGFWHSHHGYFSSCECNSVEKVLNTINVDYVVEEPKMIHKIDIRTQHKSLMNKVVIDADFMESVFEKSIEYNHKVNKEIFMDMLTETMLKRIHLKG